MPRTKNEEKIDKFLDLEWYEKKNKELRDIMSTTFKDYDYFSPVKIITTDPAEIEILKDEKRLRNKIQPTGRGFTQEQRERILEKVRPEANLINRYRKNCLMRDFLNVLYSRINSFG